MDIVGTEYSGIEKSKGLTLKSLAQRLAEKSPILGANVLKTFHSQIESQLSVSGNGQTEPSGISIRSSVDDKSKVTVSVPLGKVEPGTNWTMNTPRLVFNFRGTPTPGEIEYTGCQIGLGGSVAGVRHIVDTVDGIKTPVFARPSLPGFLSTVRINETDLDILRPFMDSPETQTQSPPPISFPDLNI
jgi:hypothetical protein